LTKSISKLLRVLTWIFYSVFIVLWFKDNIDALKRFRVSPLVALVPLVVVIGWRLVRAIKSGKIAIRFKLNKTVPALLILLALATVVHGPYLLHGERILNSDGAIYALVGKHIAEGKLAPICPYGQNYNGTLASHVYAAVFSLFGYSIPALHSAALLFYLAFIVVQFLLLKDAFSFSFAFVTSLLYSLPFGQLLVVSLDHALAWSLVLFLGSTILLLATKVGFENKTSLLPGLGFVMGLAFWTHQASISFILAAILLLLVKAHLRIKNFSVLAVYGTLGVLPLLLQEIFMRFQLVQFLFGGEKGSFAAAKVKATVQILKSLLAPLAEDKLGIVLVVVFCLGVATLVIMTIRERGRSRALAFLLFLVVFGLMHWFSRFSDKLLARYLYPLYAVLPMLLLLPFQIIKSRLKTVFAAVFVAAVVLLNGWPNHVSYAADAKKESAVLRQVIEAMRATGVKYWMADYWESYALTAISAEHPVVGPAYFNRYYPYRLAMYEGGNRPGILFLRAHGQADDFEKLLTTLGVTFRRHNVGDASLFFDIASPVYPEVFYETAPSVLPRLTLDGIREKPGFLEVSFRREDTGPYVNFNLKVEVPGYSRVWSNIPTGMRAFSVEVPAPPKKQISLRYGLDFRALEIPSTAGEITYVCAGDGPGERTDEVVFLRGIGPLITRAGRTGHDCDQTAALALRPPRSGSARLRLVLANSIDFSHCFWYGRYVQGVRVSVAGRPAEEIPLPNKRNTIEINLAGIPADGKRLAVTLEFRYGYVLDDAPNQILSAVLEKAEILD
jgi:hypothetical protein